MKLCKLACWLFVSIPCFLHAASPRSVVITDDRVIIDGTVIAEKGRQHSFQISRAKVIAALGKPTKVGQSFGSIDYSWDDSGIRLNYESNVQQCSGIGFTILPSPGTAAFEKPYRGMISINGVPLTPLTDSKIFRKLGFKNSDGTYTRSIGPHATYFSVDIHGRITFVRVEIPKIVSRAID